jgi:hypothetical protein
MEYKLKGKTYHFSLDELRKHYEEFISISDEEFMRRLPEILHFSCFVSWLNQTSNHDTSDLGVLHQLIHLLHIPEEPLIVLQDIRKQFKEEFHI